MDKDDMSNSNSTNLDPTQVKDLEPMLGGNEYEDIRQDEEIDAITTDKMNKNLNVKNPVKNEKSISDLKNNKNTNNNNSNDDNNNTNYNKNNKNNLIDKEEMGSSNMEKQVFPEIEKVDAKDKSDIVDKKNESSSKSNMSELRSDNVNNKQDYDRMKLFVSKSDKDLNSKLKNLPNKNVVEINKEKHINKPILKLAESKDIELKLPEKASKLLEKQSASKLPELTKSQLLEFKNQNKDKSNLQSPIPLNSPSSIVSSGISSPMPQQISSNTSLPPTVLNKSTLSNLNKSLKAKQKIINLSQPHPKNSTLISEIISSSPKLTKFPNSISEPDLPQTSSNSITHQLNNNISNNSNNSNLNGNLNSNLLPLPPNILESGTITPKSVTSNLVNNKLDLPSDDTANLLLDSNTTNNSTNNSTINSINPSNNISKDSSTGPPPPKPKKEKQKKVTKQNSTRTDFFAAKLASAVDDVDSSDSDETFVYDNNDNNGNNTNANTISNTLNLDNNSIHGSINPQSIYTPSCNEVGNPFDNNQTSDVQTNSQSALGQKAPNFKSNTNQTPPVTTNNRPPSIANSISSNHYLESIHNSISGNNSGNFGKDNKRLDSRKSISTFRSTDDPANAIRLYTEKLEYHSPLSTYNETAVQNFNREPSFNDNYSYDDEIEDYADDDVSTDGEFQKIQQANNNNITNTSSANTANTANTPIVPSTNDIEKIGSEKSKKKAKTSSTSSKLRSTTSKLFDKKGSQPRRYSIIPDDIDIEDFDDDLIYYDNHIRFPYGNTGGLGASETSPLVNHRIPHYRSLNLNFQGGKRILSANRYISSGQQSPLMNNPNSNNNVFPCNYDPHHQHQFYYGFDEFDEEAQIDEEGNQKRYGRGRYNSPHLSPSNNYFHLPRKKSNEYGSNRAYCIKSFIYTLFSILSILGIGFFMGFILATTKELEGVSIMSIKNPIVSEDELVFNIVVQAINPGWSTIMIEDVELDVFAKSGYLPDDDDDDDDEAYNSKALETVLLGTIINLEVPISFAGGFFNKEHEEQVGEIRLFSPGKNLTNVFQQLSNDKHDNHTIPDNSKKWEIISKNPFDLIVRGVLKYNLPLGSRPKLAQVNKSGYIDPSHSN